MTSKKNCLLFPRNRCAWKRKCVNEILSDVLRDLEVEIGQTESDIVDEVTGSKIQDKKHDDDTVETKKVEGDMDMNTQEEDDHGCSFSNSTTDAESTVNPQHKGIKTNGLDRKFKSFREEIRKLNKMNKFPIHSRVQNGKSYEISKPSSESKTLKLPCGSPRRIVIADLLTKCKKKFRIVKVSEDILAKKIKDIEVDIQEFRECMNKSF